jgi:hypothetical protein
MHVAMELPSGSEVPEGSPFAPVRAGASPRGKSDRYKQRLAFAIDKKNSRIVLLCQSHRVLDVLNDGSRFAGSFDELHHRPGCLHLSKSHLSLL